MKNLKYIRAKSRARLKYCLRVLNTAVMIYPSYLFTRHYITIDGPGLRYQMCAGYVMCLWYGDTVIRINADRFILYLKALGLLGSYSDDLKYLKSELIRLKRLISYKKITPEELGLFEKLCKV